MNDFAPPVTTGVLLFAHGARDPQWAEPFEAVRARVAARLPGRHVALAFLELMIPDLERATEAAIDAGCDRIEVVPLFLGQGSHLKRDLPARLDALRRRWPDVTFDVARAAGEDDAVLEALADYGVRCSSG